MCVAFASTLRYNSLWIHYAVNTVTPHQPLSTGSEITAASFVLEICQLLRPTLYKLPSSVGDTGRDAPLRSQFPQIPDREFTVYM